MHAPTILAPCGLAQMTRKHLENTYSYLYKTYFKTVLVFLF